MKRRSFFWAGFGSVFGLLGMRFRNKLVRVDEPEKTFKDEVAELVKHIKHTSEGKNPRTTQIFVEYGKPDGSIHTFYRDIR